MTEPKGVRAELRAKIAEIVRSGEKVRDRVAAAAAEATTLLIAGADGTAEVVESVARGAMEGARSVTDGTKLREVVLGVGDGLEKAALSAKLAFEEARGRGQAFARDDLRRLLSELGSCGSLLGEAFVGVAKEAGSVASQELDDLRRHADDVGRALTKRLEQTFGAIRSDPLGLAADAAKVAPAAARQATGALFDAMARLLERGADSMRGR